MDFVIFHHFASFNIILHHFTSFCIISHHFASFHIILHQYQIILESNHFGIHSFLNQINLESNHFGIMLNHYFQRSWKNSKLFGISCKSFPKNLESKYFGTINQILPNNLESFTFKSEHVFSCHFVLFHIILHHFVSFNSRRQGSQFFESCFTWN